MLIQIALIVLSTLMATMSAVLLWMLKDRLRLAVKEGEVNVALAAHSSRLESLERKVDSSVSRREHEDLQATVKDGMAETRQELRLMRQDISRMAGIMARATGEPATSE